MPRDVREIDGVHVVTLDGEFTLGRTGIAGALDLQGRPLPDLAAVLAGLFERDASRIVLDMREVHFVDSAGLGELVAAKKRALERGGDVRIVEPAPRVRRLFELTQLDHVFGIYDDVQAAVASF